MPTNTTTIIKFDIHKVLTDLWDWINIYNACIITNLLLAITLFTTFYLKIPPKDRKRISNQLKIHLFAYTFAASCSMYFLLVNHLG